MKAFLSMMAAVVATVSLAADLPSQKDISLLAEVTRAQERGLDWLRKQQKEDGSWNQHPAITGLAVTSFARAGRALTAEEQAALAGGVKYILSNVKPNGAIYGGGDTDKYPNYSTAICAMALFATGDKAHHDIVRRARQFLLGSQFDERVKVKEVGADGKEAEVAVEENHASYGGIGYGRRERPDLSNMGWALEALKVTESLETMSSDSPYAGSRLHWEKAVKFLSRCQNLPGQNDQTWVRNTTGADLGGFIYMPGFSFANEGQPVDEKTPLRSYASMSYAGLKSFIYADVKKEDPRVVAVINWLKRNYTLDENPGLGQQGLYYYYNMFAKSLTALGEDTFTDIAGKTHDWRYELLNKLVTLQKADGYWQNDNNRWWENDPVLVTCYSLLSIEILQKRQYP